jgi:acetate kinase
MFNEELFDDLKQFITTQNSQLEERLRSDMVTKDDIASIKNDMATLAKKADLVDVDEKLDEILKAVGERVVHADDTLRDHERRITRLEHRAA